MNRPKLKTCSECGGEQGRHTFACRWLGKGPPKPPKPEEPPCAE